jgi:hypothetical protein
LAKRITLPFRNRAEFAAKAQSHGDPFLAAPLARRRLREKGHRGSVADISAVSALYWAWWFDKLTTNGGKPFVLSLSKDVTNPSLNFGTGSREWPLVGVSFDLGQEL